LQPTVRGEEPFAPKQDKLPVPPTEGAIVLFGEDQPPLFLSMAGEEIDWPVEEGALISTRGSRRSNHIVSRWHFQDADIHVEFVVAEKGHGNSGIYIHGNYVLQIYDSYGKEKP